MTSSNGHIPCVTGSLVVVVVVVVGGGGGGGGGGAVTELWCFVDLRLNK